METPLFLTIFIRPNNHRMRQRPVAFDSKTTDLNAIVGKLKKTLYYCRGATRSSRVNARADVTKSVGIHVSIGYVISQ